MDQNQWFNSGSPAPTLDRQAFEAGWTAAQRQMAFTPQTPQINERIFQQQPQTPPPRPTYLPGRVVNSPDDIRASEIPMATLRDMWHDADPDLREKMKKDFSALLQEMN